MIKVYRYTGEGAKLIREALKSDIVGLTETRVCWSITPDGYIPCFLNRKKVYVHESSL